MPKGRKRGRVEIGTPPPPPDSPAGRSVKSKLSFEDDASSEREQKYDRLEDDDDDDDQLMPEYGGDPVVDRLHRLPQIDSASAADEAGRRHGRPAASVADGGDDKPKGDAPPQPMEPLPLRAVDWRQYEQDPGDPIVHPRFCYFCRQAQSRQQATTNKRPDIIRRFYLENHASMPPFEFVRKMQYLYNKYARYYLNQNGQRCAGPAWSAQSIYDHALEHALVPRMVREHVGRTMFTMMRLMEESLQMIDKTSGRKLPNLQQFASYRATWKDMRAILADIETRRDKNLYGLD